MMDSWCSCCPKDIQFKSNFEKRSYGMCRINDQKLLTKINKPATWFILNSETRCVITLYLFPCALFFEHKMQK